METAIVVPCYNEAGRLEPGPFVEFVSEHPNVHFCLVNDGSTDPTGDRIESIAQGHQGRITAVRLPANRGKGEAVRAGMTSVLASSAYACVGYWDADLATPLDAIPRFVGMLESRPDIHLVTGARVLRVGAAIERHWYRHYFGRFFATAVSMLLGLPIYDSQCGAKLMRAELARTVFRDPFISRWLFDVEIVARMIREKGRQRTAREMLELPLERWKDMGDSKVRLGYLPKVPFELLKIHLAYRKDRTP
jgi:glycosyltransferase involved in cell wall biosynthesis